MDSSSPPMGSNQHRKLPCKDPLPTSHHRPLLSHFELFLSLLGPFGAQYTLTSCSSVNHHHAHSMNMFTPSSLLPFDPYYSIPLDFLSFALSSICVVSSRSDGFFTPPLPSYFPLLHFLTYAAPN